MRRCLLACLAFAACKPTPASISLAGDVPALFVSTAPHPAPRVVARDAEGTLIDPTPPEVAITIDPPGVVALQNGELVPIANGEAVLRAHVRSTTIAVERRIRVQFIDRVEVACPLDPCAFKIDDEVVMGAKVYFQGQRVDVPVSWTVDLPDVLKPIEPGRFLALGPGVATVQVVAGDVRVRRDVRVAGEIDELEIVCPAVNAKQGSKGEKLCTLEQGKRLLLEVDARGRGVKVLNPEVLWSSSDPSVVNVERAGLVAGAGVGLAEITATAGKATAKMGIEVQAGCVGNWAVRIVHPGYGGKPYPIWCQNPAPIVCLKKLKIGVRPTDEQLQACCCVTRPPPEASLGY